MCLYVFAHTHVGWRGLCLPVKCSGSRTLQSIYVGYQGSQWKSETGTWSCRENGLQKILSSNWHCWGLPKFKSCICGTNFSSKVEIKFSISFYIEVYRTFVGFPILLSFLSWMVTLEQFFNFISWTELHLSRSCFNNLCSYVACCIKCVVKVRCDECLPEIMFLSLLLFASFFIYLFFPSSFQCRFSNLTKNMIFPPQHVLHEDFLFLFFIF
jgi:hypothetical protein